MANVLRTLTTSTSAAVVNLYYHTFTHSTPVEVMLGTLATGTGATVVNLQHCTHLHHTLYRVSSRAFSPRSLRARSFITIINAGDGRSAQQQQRKKTYTPVTSPSTARKEDRTNPPARPPTQSQQQQPPSMYRQQLHQSRGGCRDETNHASDREACD